MKKISCLDKGFVCLVDVMGDDSSIVQAARVSYGSGTKSVRDDEKLIRYMMRNRHTSVFEQCVLKFHVKAPLFVFRQWHRHRTMSYNELSARYSKIDAEFYVPEENKCTGQSKTNKQGGSDEYIDCPFKEEVLDGDVVRSFNETWHETYSQKQADDYDFYEKSIDAGLRRELARISLPVSMYSEMYATVNLHNLFHFLKLRTDSHAQYEMRVFAEAIEEIVKDKFPIAYKAWIDYVKDAKTFSKQEIEILRKIINSEKAKELIYGERLELTSREIDEFKDILGLEDDLLYKRNNI